MATLSAPVQRKVILRGVSGETYQRLLAEHIEAAGPHLFYDRGMLEIMELSSGHEEPNRTLAALLQTIAAEWAVDIIPLGSTTFQREELQKGFEPDSAYYIANVARMLGKPVDPAVDPPPDLIIEVDVTGDSLPRFPIYAAFGVPEVWRYSGGRVSFHRLEGGGYVETPSGPALPRLTSETATLLLEESTRLTSSQWNRRVREWARGQR